MVRVWFGILGVNFDDGDKNVVGELFLLGVDFFEESLMVLSGTKILLLLVDVAFNFEGGLWKMFGDEACGKASP